MQLSDLADVLERRTALALDDGPRPRRKGVENRLNRSRQAGGDVDEKGVGEDSKHADKKALERRSRHSRNFPISRPSCRIKRAGSAASLLVSPSHDLHMSDLAIDIRHVEKRFEQHVAVRDLSLEVPRGSVYGLLGPNGAGKTTTIRMILDVIAPDAGTISIFGVPHDSAGIRNKVGYLPEERGLYRKMQVRRILLFLAELKGVPAKVADGRITGWLERLELRTPEKDWGLAKIDELSRGMQQKVQFIGTLLHDPDLVILDEPFSGLDPINAQALKDTVVELKHRGKTVIFSTHLMDNAERLCDSVCIIAQGEKVLDGTVTNVKEEHGQRNIALALEGDGMAGVASILRDHSLVKRADDSNRFFEIELAPGADPQVLLKRIVESGASVQRFEMIQPSLHQIFLQKVGAQGVEEGMSGHG